MLGEIADAQLSRAVKAAFHRLKFARQEFGKSGLSFTVPAKERDPVILVDAQR